jgi:hypothetical protein
MPVRWARSQALECNAYPGDFREAFAAAGLQYFNPHSLRNTLVQLGETLCCTLEDFKA